MTSEKKFIDILNHMFLGVKITNTDEDLFSDEEAKYKAREKQGFVKLLKAKSDFLTLLRRILLSKSKLGQRIAKN
ncbi:hypothetical protein ABGA53_001148 [Campylobacter upsaliensis]